MSYNKDYDCFLLIFLSDHLPVNIFQKLGFFRRIFQIKIMISSGLKFSDAESLNFSISDSSKSPLVIWVLFWQSQTGSIHLSSYVKRHVSRASCFSAEKLWMVVVWINKNSRFSCFLISLLFTCFVWVWIKTFMFSHSKHFIFHIQSMNPNIPPSSHLVKIRNTELQQETWAQHLLNQNTQTLIHDENTQFIAAALWI